MTTRPFLIGSYRSKRLYLGFSGKGTVCTGTILLGKPSFLSPLTQSRTATPSQLSAVHSSALVSLMADTATSTDSERLALEDRYTSVYLNNDTYAAATTAAGSLLQVWGSCGGAFEMTSSGLHHLSVGAQICFAFIIQQIIMWNRACISCPSPRG